MESNPLQFETLAMQLVDAVKQYGLADVTVTEYRKEANRITSYSAGCGFKDYNSTVLDGYLMYLKQKVEKGELCKEQLRFRKRVIRMIRSLAETGEVDFSISKTCLAKYPIPEETSRVIDDVLNESKVFHPIRRRSMHAVIRHLLLYAHERGYEWLSLDDTIVLKFIIEELPLTNGKSKNYSLRAVKLACQYLSDKGLSSLSYDYTKLFMRSEPVSLIPAYSEEELALIAKTIDTSTKTGARDYAIILLSFGTGLRGVDITNIRFEDIDWINGSISIVQSKSAVPLVVALNGTIMNALADYILNARPECDVPEVFVTVKGPARRLKPKFSGMMDRYSKKANIRKISRRSFHSLRRSFETELVSNGIPIETVSQMAGHADISSDKYYITHNREKNAFVAMDFSDVPITEGIYANLFDSSPEGGDAV